MKKSLSIAAVYTGLVIGAGFASGREIFEYFNLSSRHDFTGIIFACLAFGALSFVIMQLSKLLCVSSFDELINAVGGKLLSGPLKLFMFCFMFCGFFVMLSACGALFESSFSLPSRTGILFLATLCFVVFVFETKGLVAANSIMVPFMIVGMIFLCVYSILFKTAEVFNSFSAFRRNFIVSAICYVSYNTITAGAVLVPLSEAVSKKTILRAASISSSILGILIFLVWSALNIYYDSIFSSQMPLLTIATNQSRLFGKLYGIILFMALCTTAISHGFGILGKFHFKTRLDRALASAILCLAAMPFARLGFSSLVSYLYSAFGFMGLIWTVLLLVRFFKSRT